MNNEFCEKCSETVKNHSTESIDVACSNQSCPCHVAHTNLEKLKEETRKEFDENFTSQEGGDWRRLKTLRVNEVHDFLSDQLAKAFAAGKEEGIAEEAIGCDNHCKIAHEKGKNGEPLYEEIPHQ